MIKYNIKIYSGVFILLLFICAISILVYMTWFAKVKTPQEVNLNPLIDAGMTTYYNSIKNIGDDIKEVDKIKSYDVITENGMGKSNGRKQPDGIKERIGFEYEGKSYVQVYVNLFYEKQDADKHYEFEQQALAEEYGICKEGEVHGNRYLLTYINRIRNSDLGLNSLTNDYLSEAIIQVGNLSIEMFEKSHDNKISAKDEVIKFLASRLKQK